MYAIIEIAGTQVKVVQDAIIEIPRIEGEVGDKINLDKVMLTENNEKVTVGTPYVDKAKISATIYAHDRTKKTVASIYKKRKQFKRSWGFRRDFTLIKITDIKV